MRSIASYMSIFLQEYLPKQRGFSLHTCDTYAYSFQLLFTFVSKRLRLSPCEITLDQLEPSMIVDFLDYLEINRDCTVSTRNVRLAAIKSFFRFLQYRLPAALDQIHKILAIPLKKTESKSVDHLSEEETQAILRAPNLQTRTGVRDHAMILLTLSAGLRVSELLGLSLYDFKQHPRTEILIHGKGRRERVLPLWKQTANCLRKWLSVRGNIDSLELFVNARGEPMTRWGFSYLLKKYVHHATDSCPSLKDKIISPHILRHTCAMKVLQATHDIRKVALWLGHSSTRTTEIYVRADPTDKLDAIEAITPPKLRKGRFQAPDKLLAILKSHTLCGANSLKSSDYKAIQRIRSP